MNYKEYRLENNLRIVAIQKDTMFTSLRIGIRVGSSYEEEDLSGISHFLEHMIFQGTKNIYADEIMDKLSMFGGDFNGYTSKEGTSYVFDVLKEDTEGILALTSDLLMNAELRNEDVERERNIIISELRLDEDNPYEFGYYNALKLAFTHKDLVRPDGGYIDNVRGITREQLYEFYKTYYVPENTTITIVSNHSHEEMKSLVEKYFGLWQNTNRIRKELNIKDINVPGEFVYENQHTEQENLYIIYSSVGLTKKEQCLLGIMSKRLGGGMSSLMAKKLRGELGITYEFDAFLNKFGDTTAMICSTTVSEENIDIAKNSIFECIESLKGNAAYGLGLDMIKKELKLKFASSSETSNSVSTMVCEHLLDSDDIEEIYAERESMENATEEELISLANKFFKNPTVVKSKSRRS